MSVFFLSESLEGSSESGMPCVTPNDNVHKMRVCCLIAFVCSCVGMFGKMRLVCVAAGEHVHDDGARVHEGAERGAHARAAGAANARGLPR